MEKLSETLSTSSPPAETPNLNVPLVSPETESFAKSRPVFKMM